MRSRQYITSKEQRKGILWINRIGLFNKMEPSIINRTNCDDFFLAFFHTPAIIKDITGTSRRAPDSLICWQPGESHYFGDDTEAWSNSWVHFNGPNARALVDHFHLNRVIEVRNPSVVNRIFSGMYYEISTNYLPDAIILNSLFEVLFRTVLRQTASQNVNTAELKNIPESILAVKNHLNRNYHQNIQIGELSKKYYISVSHLNKSFKTYFNSTPVEYLTKIRMEQAKYLLQDVNLRIIDVAHKTGYPDVCFFSKTVKKNFGCSPSELRTKLTTERKRNQYLLLYDYVIS